MAVPPDLYIGLMSGTSLDGADGVLADFSGGAGVRVLAHAARPFDAPLRAAMLALNTSGPDELHRAALCANALALLYADVVNDLLTAAGVAAKHVHAIGAHGQTVRHRPGEFDGLGYTLQLNHAALLAERTGIDVAADFRSRDVAAGGHGAPLVPAFHRAVFGREDRTMLVVNIGGISNLSVLRPAPAALTGFDCGPGNALMDGWCQRHRGAPYDASGAWAASGKVIPQLLVRLLAEPYLAAPPPKSTGRDLFNLGWLDGHLRDFPYASAVDVQTTLTELTASAIAACASSYKYDSKTLMVCGGGALNEYLMARLAGLLPTLAVEPSDLHGLPALQVEAAAFAWLAKACRLRLPGNDPTVTGAAGLRVLGAIYPA